ESTVTSSPPPARYRAPVGRTSTTKIAQSPRVVGGGASHRASPRAASETAAKARRASASRVSPASARGRPKANMAGRYGTWSAVPGGQEPSGRASNDAAYG